jgi:hypothetical protein
MIPKKVKVSHFMSVGFIFNKTQRNISSWLCLTFTIYLKWKITYINGFLEIDRMFSSFSHLFMLFCLLYLVSHFPCSFSYDSYFKKALISHFLLQWYYVNKYLVCDIQWNVINSPNDKKAYSILWINQL